MNAKIARCPAAIREELNRRIYDGEGVGESLAWLNAQPAVKQVLAGAEFDGKPVSKHNLRAWRRGRYEAWRKEMIAGERLERLARYAIAMGVSGNGMAQGCAALVAAEILMTLEGKAEAVVASSEERVVSSQAEGAGAAVVSPDDVGRPAPGNAGRDEHRGVKPLLQPEATTDRGRLGIKELGKLVSMVVRLRAMELEPRKMEQRDRWMGIKEGEAALRGRRAVVASSEDPAVQGRISPRSSFAAKTSQPVAALGTHEATQGTARTVVVSREQAGGAGEVGCGEGEVGCDDRGRIGGRDGGAAEGVAA